MSQKVRFRAQAKSDLRRLYLYIADHASDAVALAYIRRLRTACEKLETMPRRGQPRDDLGLGIRTLPFEGRATIAYRIDDLGAYVVRIFPAGLDYSRDDIPDEQ